MIAPSLIGAVLADPLPWTLLVLAILIVIPLNVR